MDTDLLIIGGGPAGLTAAIYGARMGLKVTMFEGAALGGLAGTAPKIENYPGFQSITGLELIDKMKAQADHWGAQLVTEMITEIHPKEMTVTTSANETWKAKAIVIATGSKHMHLGLPNEKELEGNGISYCATCDGPLFRNKAVAVVGGGNSAGLEAIYLAGVCKEVTLIHRRDKLRAEQAVINEIMKNPNIKKMFECEIEELIAKEEGKLSKLKIKNKKTNEQSEVRVKALFVAIGETPQTEVAKAAGIELDAENYIKVDRDMQTNIPGIYAAGDVTGGIRQVATAVGGATIAAMRAYLYIKKGWYGETASQPQ